MMGALDTSTGAAGCLPNTIHNLPYFETFLLGGIQVSRFERKWPHPLPVTPRVCAHAARKARLPPPTQFTRGCFPHRRTRHPQRYWYVGKEASAQARLPVIYWMIYDSQDLNNSANSNIIGMRAAPSTGVSSLGSPHILRKPVRERQTTDGHHDENDVYTKSTYPIFL